MHLPSLPIDDHLADIRDAVDRRRALVLVADPGAGKTTRVPPALVSAGPAIVLQPRRSAARAIARRIAEEQNWQLGHQVGWQVRFERNFTAATQLLIATEGILTARMQHDPLLSGFATVILDEFHERSIHADLAIALLKQALLAREDLRVVVMSATIDADRLSEYLSGCPIIRIPGRRHSLQIDYQPGVSTAEAALAVLPATAGSLLCFEPGHAEIERTVSALRSRVGAAVEVVALHGGLDSAAQDRAMTPSERRRIIVATNIAETSLTVPNVDAVIDSGLEKVARYDPVRAIDSLTLERASAASADQRAGRAARTGPGIARRLWDRRDRLKPYREPDVHRIDLSAVALDIVAWGGDPRTLDWFDPPRESALQAALDLLEQLGALHANRLTEVGRAMVGLPLPPRLARIIIAAGGHQQAVRAATLLAERQLRTLSSETTSCDLFPALDRWDQQPEAVRRAARELERVTGHLGGLAIPLDTAPSWEERLRRALFAGYPDRVAARREPKSTRFLLATGTGATLGTESAVRQEQYLVALDVQSSNHPLTSDSRIRVASGIDRAWLTRVKRTREHFLDEGGSVRAREVITYGAIRLAEHPLQPDAEQAQQLLAEAWMKRPRTDGALRLLRRLAFAGCEVDLKQLAQRAAVGLRALRDLEIETALDRELAARLNRDAPATLSVPSGRQVQLHYAEDGSVSASVKLQELFGLAETPRLGPRREPVLLELLAPNGRPVQLTRDLRSFWDGTYPEVRKELRGRYPRHPWPDDPWTATPTHRTTRRT